MKKVFSLVLACAVCFLFLIGCSSIKKADSDSQAISIAKGMDTIQQQKDYLISQAKVFYKSKEFQQAVNIAQYILNNIDKEFQPAKDLAEEAKAKIQETLDNQIDKIKF
jgi:hypothetical protein